jgi:hypothetical protein
MPRYKLVNGERIQLTAEEEAQRDQEEADWNAGAFDRAMANLRQNRNSKLAETDFYALSDVTMSEDMTTYRQNLRDITNGLSTIEDVNNN